jgi:hypothetical protein
MFFFTNLRIFLTCSGFQLLAEHFLEPFVGFDFDAQPQLVFERINSPVRLVCDPGNQ